MFAHARTVLDNTPPRADISESTHDVCVFSPPEMCLFASLDLQLNHTTLVDGYLGMSNDEERSEMRYVVRIAEFSESSKL